MSIGKRSRTLEARLYERYPERLRQPLAFNAEGQDLRADGPALTEFPFSSIYARFIGNPIDFVAFDGYTHANYELGDSINVVLMKVKKGEGRLTRENTSIKRVGSGCHSRKKD